VAGDQLAANSGEDVGQLVEAVVLLAGDENVAEAVVEPERADEGTVCNVKVTDGVGTKRNKVEAGGGVVGIENAVRGRAACSTLGWGGGDAGEAQQGVVLAGDAEAGKDVVGVAFGNRLADGIVEDGALAGSVLYKDEATGAVVCIGDAGRASSPLKEMRPLVGS
jgi:hypothetical protein